MMDWMGVTPVFITANLADCSERVKRRRMSGGNARRHCRTASAAPVLTDRQWTPVLPLSHPCPQVDNLDKSPTPNHWINWQRTFVKPPTRKYRLGYVLTFMKFRSYMHFLPRDALQSAVMLW